MQVRKDQLDLIVSCETPENSMLAMMLGVMVEAEGKPGKEKKRLALRYDEDTRPVDLPRSARHRLGWMAEDDEDIVPYNAWLLKPSIRKAKVESVMDDDVEAILQKYPGLTKLLKEDGLL